MCRSSGAWYNTASAFPPLAQWATVVLPLTGHSKDTPSGCTTVAHGCIPVNTIHPANQGFSSMIYLKPNCFFTNMPFLYVVPTELILFSPFLFYQYVVPNGTLLRINYATAIKPEGLSYQTTFYKIRGIRLFMSIHAQFMAWSGVPWPYFIIRNSWFDIRNSIFCFYF